VSTYSKTLRSLAVAFSVAALAEASAMPSADADQRSIRCDRTRIAGDGPVRVCESKARVTIEPALDGAGRDLPDEALAPASFLARAHRSGAELKTQLDLAFGARLQSESRPGRRRERHRGGFRRAAEAVFSKAGPQPESASAANDAMANFMAFVPIPPPSSRNPGALATDITY